MNLVLDIGNSRIKGAVFSAGKLIDRFVVGSSGRPEPSGEPASKLSSTLKSESANEWKPEPSGEPASKLSSTLKSESANERKSEPSGGPEPELSGIPEIAAILKKYPSIRHCILSSTQAETTQIEKFLAAHIRHFVRFDNRTPTPLRNLYLTPETLGADRLAAAVGANFLYPGGNLLVIDCGTAMTIDAVTAKGEYLGGNISPGARMRLLALRDYTGRLPLVKLTALDMPDESRPSGNSAAGVDDAAASDREITLLGNTTIQAIERGVVDGMLFELEGYVARLSGELGELKVIFTGGEAKLFENKLKNAIFAHRDLVLIGLNTILEYNADKK